MTRAEALGLPCYRCGKPIDWTLTRMFPNHRLAGTAHHIVGLAESGDPYDQANLAPAHRGCNTRMSNAIRSTKRAPRQPVRTSRQW